MVITPAGRGMLRKDKNNCANCRHFCSGNFKVAQSGRKRLLKLLIFS